MHPNDYDLFGFTFEGQLYIDRVVQYALQLLSNLALSFCMGRQAQGRSGASSPLFG